MPHVLSPLIYPGSDGMWSEGAAYEKKNIYSIEDGKLPPVNYDEHIVRPHSLTHIETPAHTQANGKTLESYFSDRQSYFYGKTVVIKLPGNNYIKKGENHYHWVISVDEIKHQLEGLGISGVPAKLLITTNFYPLNKFGFHDPFYVLTLSQEAADYLISHDNFELYGTSWKSSDFNPGRNERPIHNTLFKRALILENLDLKSVSEGIYFMSAFPLPLVNASESPVVPVLFEQHEFFNIF